MALNLHIHFDQYSQQPVTLNISLSSHDNCEGAVPQHPIHSPPAIQYPAPTRKQHAQVVSIPTSPLPLERGFDVATNTSGSLSCAKCKQWHWKAPFLSLRKNLVRGLSFKPRVIGAIECCCGTCRENKFYKAARQNMDTNGHVAACHLKASVKMGLNPNSRCCRPTNRYAQPGSHLEDSEQAKDMGAICAVQEPDAAGNDPVVLNYRGIELIVRKPNDEVDSFVATQDTGADLSVMTVETAASLGYEPSERKRGTKLKGIGKQLLLSLGTVQIPFWLLCDGEERRAEFHLVHDLGGHQALLGVHLTMELGHLLRPRCACEGSALS